MLPEVDRSSPTQSIPTVFLVHARPAAIRFVLNDLSSTLRQEEREQLLHVGLEGGEGDGQKIQQQGA